MKKISFLLIFYFSLSSLDLLACIWTSKANGEWTDASTWNKSNASCANTPPAPGGGGGISTGDTIIIGHTVFARNFIQVNNGTTLNIISGGNLKMQNVSGTTKYQLSSSYGSPKVNIGPNAILEAASIAWAHGNFTNSGRIDLVNDFSITAGTVNLANNGTTVSEIIAANVIMQNSATAVSIDGRLNLTGNLRATSSAALDIRARTIISGIAEFAGGQNMKIHSGVYVEATSVYVHNSSNLIVDGFLNATGLLRIGWNPAGYGSGSSKINGNGVVGWGSLTVDNNNNFLGCVANPTCQTRYGYCSSYTEGTTSCPACTAPTASTPVNPLDLVSCDAGILSTDFIELTAEPTGAAVLLTWSTKSENYKDHFTIESATDQNQWNELGTVIARTNTKDFEDYDYYDYSSNTTNKYYRVKQVDVEGNVTYSPVVMVKAGNNNRGIYPQPLSGNTLTVNYPDATSWSLSSLSGTRLFDGNFTSSEKIIDFTSAALLPGVYLLQIQTESEIFQEKLVVKGR